MFLIARRKSITMQYDREAHEVVQEALKNLREEAKAAKISYDLPPEPKLDPVKPPPERHWLISWWGVGFGLFWLWIPAVVLWMDTPPKPSPSYAPRSITTNYAPTTCSCPCQTPPLPTARPDGR